MYLGEFAAIDVGVLVAVFVGLSVGKNRVAVDAIDIGVSVVGRVVLLGAIWISVVRRSAVSPVLQLLTSTNIRMLIGIHFDWIRTFDFLIIGFPNYLFLWVNYPPNVTPDPKPRVNIPILAAIDISDQKISEKTTAKTKNIKASANRFLPDFITHPPSYLHHS
jgi:hypothetical protein